MRGGVGPSCAEQQILSFAAGRKCLGFFAIGFGLSAKPFFQWDRLFETSSLHDARAFHSLRGGSATGVLITGNCHKDRTVITKGYASRGRRRDNKYQVYCRSSKERLKKPIFKAFFAF